jgi:hypothetical protein
MGQTACINRSKEDIVVLSKMQSIVEMKKPLITLRQNLLKKLNLTDDHYFSIFANYRFWYSYRRSVTRLHDYTTQKIKA